MMRVSSADRKALSVLCFGVRSGLERGEAWTVRRSAQATGSNTRMKLGARNPRVLFERRLHAAEVATDVCK